MQPGHLADSTTTTTVLAASEAQTATSTTRSTSKNCRYSRWRRLLARSPSSFPLSRGYPRRRRSPGGRHPGRRTQPSTRGQDLLLLHGARRFPCRTQRRRRYRRTYRRTYPAPHERLSRSRDKRRTVMFWEFVSVYAASSVKMWPNGHVLGSC